MTSLTQWTWVWVDSRSWWWTGRPGVLRFMGSQRVGHDWATELNWIDALFDFSFWLTSLCIVGSRFIHLCRTGPNAFLTAEYYSIAYTYHNFFIHSSIDGHLGGVHVLAIVNSAVMNAGVHGSFSVIVFSGYMPVVGWLDRTVVLSYLFKESSYCLP